MKTIIVKLSQKAHNQIYARKLELCARAKKDISMAEALDDLLKVRT
jgi:hypothetical protein